MVIPFRRATRAAAPWVRTRLRSAPGAALALALLVAVTSALAAAFPRALERYEDAGLRHSVEQVSHFRSVVTLSAPTPLPNLPQEQREQALRPATVKRYNDSILGTVRRPFVPDPGQSSYGVVTSVNQAVPEPWLPRPSGLPARVALVAQAGLADHARLSEGRPPRASATVTATTPEVEAAVTAETAKSLRIKVGSVLHVPGAGRDALAVRITGIVEPRHREGAYWATDTLLRTPVLMRVAPVDPESPRYWLGALLLPPEAAPALLGTEGRPYRYWRLAPDPHTLRHRDLGAFKSALAALVSGPGLQQIRTATDPLTDADTGLDDVLTSYTRLHAGVLPLIAVAAFGGGTVAAVVLALAGGLAADRRRTELALLRARGASLPGLAARLLAETAVVAVPAGALGLAVAMRALPGARALPAVLAALAVTVFACAALPLRAAAAHRLVRIPALREDVTSVRPSRRRTVAELTLVAVAVGAVVTLRRQGTSGGSGDQLISAAPVLVGVIAALLLVRLYPLPLRGLAGPAGRLRGVVGHLALARSGRGSASAVLPLLALLTALTTASFGGSVLAGIGETRDHAALLAVGADARVESTVDPLPAQLAERVRRVPGVRDVAAVSIAYRAKPDDGRQDVPVVGVDPGGYAELTRRTGLGAFSEAAIEKGPGDSGAGAVLPAVASPRVADSHGSSPFPVTMEDGSSVTVSIVLVRDATPAVPGADFLVVDRAGLDATPAKPTTLLVTGPEADGRALREAAGGEVSVRLRADERARYIDSPLQSGAEHLYTAAVAAGAGYAVLTLLLSLLRAAPERVALLARLRTMGLTRAQGRRLLVLESLPQAALAAAGGVLTGWCAIRLLAPGMDLTAVALPPSAASLEQIPLYPDPWSLTVPTLSVVALTVGIAGVQAWWAGRRGAVRELRAGDTM
ncbi:putative ABC transport system permease protein [Streptomyces sp. B4I13]|uniref:FtsX-like permease family protein n=1 Tax=Streptomyces sp. B4I13 TaxID=3042271 RepID=UPI00277D4408|nr:FtsX-like permease family protein [Streptomyces sp. B4I13]MDQ0964451.1 putative ABC transport system permease protein [Streptomyces sp. B4I13]